MTSRERVRLVLENKVPDRLPFNFWMDRDKMVELDAELGENFRVSHYDADVIETFTGLSFFRQLAGNAQYVDDGKTRWMLRYPAGGVLELLDADLPDADDQSLYDGIRDDRRKYPDKALFALIASPLEILLDNVGMERLFCDMIEEPEAVGHMCARLSDVLYKAVAHIAACDVDVLYLAGDICSTRGELMSSDMLRRYCFDPMRPLVRAAHEHGLKVFYHTDGHVMNILPLFVEYGFDGINPLQASAGNDVRTFVRLYGDKLMVYGALDNCFIIPDGSESDVRLHVRERFEALGRNGRYIASSHDIPSYAPSGNVDAMVDEVKRCIYQPEKTSADKREK